MKVAGAPLAQLAELMGLDADEFDALALREWLTGLIDDTDELNETQWLRAIDASQFDVLRLDPAGGLLVARGSKRDYELVCELDPDHYPPEIGARLAPHYDLLCDWVEKRGLVQTRRLHRPGCDSWV